MVESYVNPQSIYDSTTYIKGREVFRCLQTYMDMMVPEGFRRLKISISRGMMDKRSTFRELLSSANEILGEYTDENLSQFER